MTLYIRVLVVEKMHRNSHHQEQCNDADKFCQNTHNPN